MVKLTLSYLDVAAVAVALVGPLPWCFLPLVAHCCLLGLPRYRKFNAPLAMVILEHAARRRGAA